MQPLDVRGITRRQQVRQRTSEHHARQRRRREARRCRQEHCNISEIQPRASQSLPQAAAIWQFCQNLGSKTKSRGLETLKALLWSRCPSRWVSPPDAEDPSKTMPEVQVLTFEQAGLLYDFGPAAFGPLEPLLSQSLASRQGDDEREEDADDNEDENGDLQAEVATMVLQSVPSVRDLRGQRGERLVTEMLTTCYSEGLFMHGPPDSPLNSLIIPAMRHIFAEMSQLPPSHGKRVDCLSTLAYACQDCQQVQAREIMRIYGDLTSRNTTLEKQFKYSLVRDKETSLNIFISEHHPNCDLDHRQVSPWQQRPHLISGYTFLIGEAFGLDSVTSARSDRFLNSTLDEIGHVDPVELIEELRKNMSVRAWLRMLLADINNQSDGADRLIDRETIFRWVQTNMSTETAYSVFYEEERQEEFAELDPTRPTDANCYQPFLSLRVLVDILMAAGLLQRKQE